MSNESIDISGLDRADILAALYNNSRPQGRGFSLQPDATALDGRLYDRDNGQGSAERAIAGLRSTGSIKS